MFKTLILINKDAQATLSSKVAFLKYKGNLIW